MSLESWAALAEIIAAVSVIFSLLFVGFQIKEGNRQAQASAKQDAMMAELQMSSVLAEHADVWDRVVTGEDIPEGADRRKAIQLYNILMSESENRFFQFKQGYLEKSTWEARQQTLVITSGLPIYKYWRNSLSGQNHSEDFLKMLDSFKH